MKLQKKLKEYIKDFIGWNTVKKETHELTDYLPLYHERQVRWCKLGVNIGFEQDGTGDGFSRPVLILKGLSRNVCIVLPLTTSEKENKYHVSIGEIDGRKSFVIISQIRLIDTRRLDTLIGTLSDKEFQTIRKAVKDIL